MIWSKKVAFLALSVVLAFLVVPAYAQDLSGGLGGIHFSGAFGAAFTIMGAAYGIGMIGRAAVENMARQPEVAGQIQTAMIIAAALIEGVTFFALVICLLDNAKYFSALAGE